MPIDLTYLKPPEEDLTKKIALVANTACVAQEMWPANDNQVRKVCFICTADFFLTISKDNSGTVTAPVITSVAGGSICRPIPRMVVVPYVLGSRNRYFRAISEEACYLSWWVED